MPSWNPLKPIPEGKPLDRIQRATCALVLENGIDEVSVSAAIKASEVSRRTFYSYYESVAAVLADVWLHNGLDWIEGLSGGSTKNIGVDLEKVLIYSLAISHRVEELHEVISDDLNRIWQGLSSSPAAQLGWAWRVALVIGHGLHSAAKVAPSGPEIQNLIKLLQTTDLSKLPEPSKTVRFTHKPIEILDEDQTTQRLLNATVTVVGKSGAVRTNVLRICRRAKVSAGALVGRFNSPDEVVSMAFRSILDAVLKQNLAAQYMSAGYSLEEWYSASIRAGLGPNRAGWRKFRREIVIASCHSEAIRRQAVESLVSADRPLREYLEDTKLQHHAQSAALCFNREISEGLSILLDLGIPVDELNHVPGTRVALQWLNEIS